MILLLAKTGQFHKTIVTTMREESGHIRQVFESNNEQTAERFARACLKPGEDVVWVDADSEEYRDSVKRYEALWK